MDERSQPHALAPFTPREKRARYPVTWRLRGPKRWSGPSVKKKGHLLWRERYEVSRFHCCLGCSLDSIPTELWKQATLSKFHTDYDDCDITTEVYNKPYTPGMENYFSL